MFERFTETARQVVMLAQQEARDQGHGEIESGHILCGLLLVPSTNLAVDALDAVGVRLDDVRERMGQREHASAVARRLAQAGDDESKTAQIPFTKDAKQTLELALREALSLGHNYIGPEHVLLACVRTTSAEMDGLLADSAGDPVGPEAIRNEVLRCLSRPTRRGEATATGVRKVQVNEPRSLLLRQRGDSVALTVHELGSVRWVEAHVETPWTNVEGEVNGRKFEVPGLVPGEPLRLEMPDDAVELSLQERGVFGRTFATSIESVDALIDGQREAGVLSGRPREVLWEAPAERDDTDRVIAGVGSHIARTISGAIDRLARRLDPPEEPDGMASEPESPTDDGPELVAVDVEDLLDLIDHGYHGVEVRDLGPEELDRLSRLRRAESLSGSWVSREHYEEVKAYSDSIEVRFIALLTAFGPPGPDPALEGDALAEWARTRINELIAQRIAEGLS